MSRQQSKGKTRVTDSMPHDHEHASARKGFAFAHLAFLLALLPPILLLVCMMVTHLGYIDDDLGFRTLTLGIGPKLAGATLAIAGLSLLISLFMAPKRCAPWALGAVAVSGGLLGGYAWYQKTLKAFPPIADVATDWDQPLSFSDTMTKVRGLDAKVVEDLPRVPRDESLEWGGKTVPDINALTCSGAHPVMRSGVNAGQVAQLLTSQGYTIVSQQDRQVEGTWQDNFFGFKYDVAVRIAPTRVDVREISRYDMPDMGVNCHHVTAIVNGIAGMPDAPSVAAADMSENAFSESATDDGDDGGDE